MWDALGGDAAKTAVDIVGHAKIFLFIHSSRNHR